MLPFLGFAHVGYVPADRLVGLSKVARVVDHFARGLQVQERLTTQISVLSLLGAAALSRRRLQFLGVATLAVLVGGWIGGDLVFHYGWRIRPAEEAEIAEKEFAEAGIDRPFARARREVSDFERRKTFLGR